MLAVKGVVSLANGPDLDLLPFALPFMGLGIVGMYGYVAGRPERLARVGRLLAYATLATALLSLVAGLFVALDALGGVEAIPDIAWPIHVLTLALVFPLAVSAAMVLGLAVYRVRALPPVRRALPLAVGVLWMPLFLVGEAIGDAFSPNREVGLGFVFAGVAWIVLGYVLWAGPRLVVRRNISSPLGV